MKHNMFYTAVIAVLVSSCGHSSGSSDKQLNNKVNEVAPADTKKEEDKKPGVSEDASAPATAAADTTTVQVQNFDSSVLQSGNPVIDWDKKIIKTANVTLELKDYAGYNNTLHTKLKGYGAYIAQENQNETDEQIANEVTIKVPVDKFDDLMNSLSGDDIKVLEKNISTEDVTGEVVDTKARLEAKKEVRAKYLELLKQAKNIDEILQVQNEINGIQEDIESADGRLGYLTHSAAYSTINLKYYQFLNGLTSKDVEPNFLTKVGEAFKNGASVITNLVVFFISIWPLVIIAALFIFYFKKRKAKSVSIVK